MNRTRCTLLLTCLAGGLASSLLAGCTEYRIEYHRRPSYYEQASEEELPDRIVMPDGTVIVYVNDFTESSLSKAAKTAGADEEEETGFMPRRELEDGTIVLRSILPEHVIINTMTCLRNQEYDLIWDQLLADQTRLSYSDQGLGSEDFAKFCRENRRDLMTTLNRMSFGFMGQDVYIQNIGEGVMRCQFSPRIMTEFKYRQVDIVSELGGLKLLLIH